MPDPHDASLSPGPGPIVLVVDDERTPRSIICRMVRGLGYQVVSCPGGREALRFLQAYPREVRVLIADVAMPRMDGGELVERARDLDPSLRVVLMAEPGDARAAALLEGYRDLPLLSKPVGFGDLYRKLEELVGIPPRPTSHPPSMEAPASRPRRRSSGHHEV